MRLHRRARGGKVTRDEFLKAVRKEAGDGFLAGAHAMQDSHLVDATLKVAAELMQRYSDDSCGEEHCGCTYDARKALDSLRGETQ